MEFKFFLGFFVSLAIALIAFVNFYENHKKEKFKKPLRYILFIGFVYLILSVLSFIWFFEFINYSSQDFIFIYASLMLLQGIFLFIIIYPVLGNKSFYYFLGFFISIFFIILFLPSFFMKLFIVLYFLFILLLSIGLIFKEGNYKKSGVLGISYSTISVIFYIPLLLGFGEIYFFSVLFNLQFLLFFLSITKSLEEILIKSNRKKSKKNYVFIFLSHFVFMLVIINFVLVGTVVLHEFGHLTSSNFFDCSSGRIVYDEGLPRTEVFCLDNSNLFYVLIGGVAAPMLLATILFIVGGRFLREISLLIIGFNLIASSKDFSDIGLTSNQIIFFILGGIVLGILGIVFMAKTKTEDYLYAN